MYQVRFRSWQCVIRKRGYYANGRLALQLYDAEDGAPVATATVNVPGASVPEGHVLIKDWSENAGMTQALVDAGIIGEPVGRIPTEYVYADLCPLLVQF